MLQRDRQSSVLGLTNELCSEVKLSLRFALERKEVNLHISIQHTLCSPLWSRLHAWVLGTLVWISEVGGTGRLAALGFGSEVAVRTAPFEPPAPTNPFLPSLVLASSITKPVKVLSVGRWHKAQCSQTQKPLLSPAQPRLSPPAHSTLQNSYWLPCLACPPISCPGGQKSVSHVPIQPSQGK